ncbi:MAG TPA: polysaccharide biosynthesis/export family protein [Candidatus Baltobacteraceae bacterium]|nr:polysaccharide biosynthesis/export family protein [Candidatus Baltobacteraceae bacterium]
MITVRHLSSALAAAAAAVLLAAAPLAVRADDTGQPGPGTQPQTIPLPQRTVSDPNAPHPIEVPDGIIHPGDQVAISVYGEQPPTQTLVVQADGTIQYPLVGKVAVAGKTPTQARDAVTAALTKYVRHPIVTLAVTQPGQISVTVLGNVKSPGHFQLRSGAHLTEAIAAASGVNFMNGNYPPARVSQPDGSIATVSLQKLLRDGDATQNVPLSDDALVYVTGAETIRVQVFGAVTRPGNVEVNEGDTLEVALARAGLEAGTHPDLNRVYLTRTDPATGKTQSYQIDVYEAVQHSDHRFDPVLQKDDKIYVPETRQPSPVLLTTLAIIGRVLGF